MTKDPHHLLAYFMDQLLCREGDAAVSDETRGLAAAYRYGLSPKTQGRLDYNAFYLAVTHEERGVKPLELDVTRRLLRGIEQHEMRVQGDSATAVWCNREFGFHYPVRLVCTRVGRIKTPFWAYDFTLEELQNLVRVIADSAMAWFRRQRELADGRLYSYPPDWQYSPLERDCLEHAKKP